MLPKTLVLKLAHNNMEEITPLQATEQYSSPRPSRREAKIAAAIIVLSFISTGSLLAARVWDPLWSPFRPEPEEVISQMAEKTKEIKTAHLISDISLRVKENGKDAGAFSVKIEGDSDNSDLANRKSGANLNLVFSGEGMEIFLALENITIGDTSYIKLTTLPALPILEPILAILGIDLNKVKNQWIKIDEESVKEIAGNFPAQKIEESERQKEAEKRLNDLLANKKLYLVKKEFPDEEIKGEKAYHYSVALNKSELKDLIPEAIKILQGTGGEELSGAGSLFSEFFDQLGNVTADIWIGKKDNFLRKLKGQIEIKLPEKTDDIISIDFLLEFSNFNQPIKIEAPSGSKTIKEVLTPPVGGGILGSLESSRSKARDARRMSDLQQMSIAMEIYYGDNEKYFTSKTMPTEIPGFELALVPKDPGSGPCPSYQWISNVSNPQKYCAWACLENGSYYVISHKEREKTLAAPVNLDCNTAD